MEPQRSSFRLIDALAIGLLLLAVGSLAMPGLESVRRLSNRERCQSNLAALGAAMLAFHDTAKTFPSGITVEPSGGASPMNPRPASLFVATSGRCDHPDSAFASAFTQLLPYVGHQKTFDAYNHELACCATPNATAVAVTVRAFVCPANANVGCKSWGYYESRSWVAAAGPATTDYALSIGGAGMFTDVNPFAYMGCGLAGWPGISRRSAGAFNVNWAASIDRIKDGTANTFLMGEAYSGAAVGVRLDRHLPRGNEAMDVRTSPEPVLTPWSQGYIGGAPIYRGGRRPAANYGGFGSVFAATAWNAFYDTNGNLTTPDRWFALPLNEGRPGQARATFYRDPHPEVNFMALDGSCIPGDNGSVQGFRSLHPTVPMLFADGSVRQIKPTIDPRLWVALSSCIGREQIPDGF